MDAPNMIFRYKLRDGPDRNFDWSVGTDDDKWGHQIGFGATWQEALLDLAEQLVE